MAQKTRRKFTTALRDDKTIAQLSSQFELHLNQITEPRKQFVERAGDVFDGVAPRSVEPPVDLKVQHAKIDQQTEFVGISRSRSSVSSPTTTNEKTG